MKELSKIIGIGVLIGFILFLIQQVFRYTSGETIEFSNELWIYLAYHMMYAVPITLVNAYYFGYLNEKVVWKGFIKKYRFLLGVLGSVTATLLTVFLVRTFEEMVLEGETYNEFIATEHLANNIDSSKQAQRWLMKFCQNLRTNFAQVGPSFQLTDCFIEHFANFYMSGPCPDHVHQPLCCNKSFPFDKVTFKVCIKEYMLDLGQSTIFGIGRHSPGPKFENGVHPNGLIVQLQSKLRYTRDYQQVKEFYTKVNNWVNKEMIQAPKEMRYGWFVSFLDFFDAK